MPILVLHVRWDNHGGLIEGVESGVLICCVRVCVDRVCTLPDKHQRPHTAD